MKKIVALISLVAAILYAAQVQAQQVATIGLGDITFSAKQNVKARSTEQVLNTLNSDIKSALLRTRKFSVLEFDELKTRLRKQDRNLAGYYAKQYTGNAVWQEGLDFILKADVSDFGFLSKTGDTSGNTVGVVNINFELLGVADVTYDFKSRISGQFSAKIKPGNVKAEGEILDRAIKKSVEQLVDKIVSSLLAIHIVKIVDDEDEENYGDITLNYGSGFLRSGDRILVYAPETEEIIDDLGQAVGEVVANLEVISTNQKFSIAKVLEAEKIRLGEIKPLEKGQKGRLVLSLR